MEYFEAKLMYSVSREAAYNTRIELSASRCIQRIGKVSVYVMFEPKKL